MISIGKSCKGKNGYYTITSKIASGGMGHVFEAKDQNNREVIVKVPTTHMPDGTLMAPNYHSEVIKKLKVEGQVLKNFQILKPQCIVQYIDESYDSIVSPGERIQFIIKEIEKVCSLNKDELHDIYLKILPKVIHNQQHFLNMDIKDLVFDVWNKIFIDQTGTYE